MVPCATFALLPELPVTVIVFQVPLSLIVMTLPVSSADVPPKHPVQVKVMPVAFAGHDVVQVPPLSTSDTDAPSEPIISAPVVV